MYRHPLDVLYEDDALLIVDKPPNLLTMGGARSKPSLHEAVKRYCAHASDQNDAFVAIPGRLDFPVGGVVVIAKSPAVANELRQQTDNRTFRKRYHAIVEGRVANATGHLRNWILSSPRHRHVSIVPEETSGARMARLTYSVLMRAASVTLCSIDLETGRKHQVRAQFSQAGHPILGDRKYGSTTPFSQGIALFCKSVRLMHPESGQELSCEARYPESWEDAIDRFR